jgi:hypothetical protein
MAHPENGHGAGARDHIDEGMAHAWLDGQLSADDAARVEAHIAGCGACAARVAEARGFVAASSRILTGLDDVPGRVVTRARPRVRIWQVRAAAAVVVVALGAAAVLSDPSRVSELRRVAGLGVKLDSAPVTRDRAGVDTARRATDAAAAPAVPSPPPAPLAQVPSQSSPSMKKTMVGPRHDDNLEARAKQDVASRAAVRSPAGGADGGVVALSSAVGGASAVGDQLKRAERKNAAQMAAAPAPPLPAAADSVARDSMGTVRSFQREAYAARTSAQAVAPPVARRGYADTASATDGASGSNPGRTHAYRTCAGRVVSVPVGVSSAGAGSVATAVRLDSTRSGAARGGFVVTSALDDGAIAGAAWLPINGDSALVSMTAPHDSTIVPSVDATPAGKTDASHVITVRVACVTP